MKLIAFPYAGGNKYSYNFLTPFLDKTVHFKILECAGRGDRIRESLQTSIQEIVNDLWLQLKLTISKDDQDYILYGHSMGALITFLMCHKIQEQGFRKPIKIVVSGKKGPKIPREHKIWNYPSAKFWEELISLGGVPKEIQEETSIRNFFEPVIKADMKAVEEYVYNENKILDVPIDVLYGSNEVEGDTDFVSWKDETTAQVTLQEFKGNHFFIHNHAQDIANFIVRRI